MIKQTLIPCIILLLLGAGCSAQPAISREEKLATIVANTLTAQPVFTPIPTFTATSLPTGTVVPVVTLSGPYYITTTVQNVNLRVQPGTLFQVSRVMAQGTRLQVLGLSPGGEWAYVLNDEGVNGWVGIQVVSGFPVEQFPTVEPGEVQRITGRVIDVNGLPVSGIGFAIEQNTASKSLRTDAATDATGTFYAYLPLTVSEAWTVSHVSIACTSNLMDAHCNCVNNACGSPEPVSIPVSLPAVGPLTFIWK